MKQVLTKLSMRIFQHILEQKGGEGNEPIFHILSGTSLGAINAAILVSYVKENKSWEGSGEKLVEFWEYLSTHS